MTVEMLQPEPDEFASDTMDSSVLDMDEEIESMRQHHRERWKRQQENKHSRIRVFFTRAWCKLKPGYSSNGDSGSSLRDDLFYHNELKSTYAISGIVYALNQKDSYISALLGPQTYSPNNRQIQAVTCEVRAREPNFRNRFVAAAANGDSTNIQN